LDADELQGSTSGAILSLGGGVDGSHGDAELQSVSLLRAAWSLLTAVRMRMRFVGQRASVRSATGYLQQHHRSGWRELAGHQRGREVHRHLRVCWPLCVFFVYGTGKKMWWCSSEELG
jgi:hypothetical protein